MKFYPSNHMAKTKNKSNQKENVPSKTKSAWGSCLRQWKLYQNPRTTEHSELGGTHWCF